MNRRMFLTAGCLVACGLSGLVTGVVTASQTNRKILLPSKSMQRPTFHLQSRFLAHGATVRTVAWAPSGNMLASGGDDTRIFLWAPDGSVQHRRGYQAPVLTLAWSPDGQRLVAGAASTIIFIATQTGQLLVQPQQAHRATVTSVAWVGAPGHPVVSGSLDRQAIVWETRTYSPQRVFLRHTAPIESVASTASSDGIVASASQGGVIRVWRQNTLQEVHGFYQDAAVAMHTAAFSPTGSHLAVGGHDGIIRVWENGLVCQQITETTNEPHCVDVPHRIHAHLAPVHAVAWSPDGNYLATGGDDQQVIIWKTNTFDHLVTLTHDAPVLSLSWAPSGTSLAVASGKAIQIWKLTVL